LSFFNGTRENITCFVFRNRNAHLCTVFVSSRLFNTIGFFFHRCSVHLIYIKKKKNRFTPHNVYVDIGALQTTDGTRSIMFLAVFADAKLTPRSMYPRVVRDWLVAAVGRDACTYTNIMYVYVYKYYCIILLLLLLLLLLSYTYCYIVAGADTIWLSLSVTYYYNIWCICFFSPRGS
jgi:hypothetical protein